MKLFIALLIVIVASVSAYTIYGLLSFTPDEPQPFVFSEPTLPPELVEKNKVTLSPEDQKKQDIAISRGKQAITQYRSQQDTATPQVKESLSVLIGRISNWEVPSYFLSAPDMEQAGMRNFEMLNLDVKSTAIATSDQTSVNCTSNAGTFKVLVGSASQDTLKCDLTRDVSGQKNDGDFVFIGGPGNDIITDAPGNRIVNGGTGNDTISLAQGRSIVILDAAWGHDTLTIDCKDSAIKDSELRKDFPIPWIYKTSNFIVLGSGIDAKDVSWKGNVLTNTLTGDTLSVNENCFTVLPRAE